MKTQIKTDPIRHNFEILKGRRKGHRYSVKNGRLEKMGSFFSLLDRVKCFVLKTLSENMYAQSKKPVKEAIEALTEAEDLLSLDIYKGVKDKPSQITSLFGKLARLNENLFDRSKISDRTIKVLTDQINLKAEDSSPHAEAFKKLVKAARLSHFLGIRTLSGDGCSGSYVFKDLKGKKLGIFKPEGEDSLGEKAPALWRRAFNAFCRLFEISGSRYTTMGNVGHLAEVATYRIAERDAGLKGLVPLTGLAHLPIGNEVKFGSLQQFIEGAQSATTYFSIDKDYKSHKPANTNKANEVTQKEFEKLVILDVLTGNLDRHAENWLVIPDKQIIAIDGGMAFSDTHSETMSERSKQYYWANRFDLANHPFSEESKKIIQHYYENRSSYAEELQAFFAKTHPALEKDDEIATNRANRFMERVEMLYHFSHPNDPKTAPRLMRDLANYRTSGEINSFIEQSNPKPSSSADLLTPTEQPQISPDLLPVENLNNNL